MNIFINLIILILVIIFIFINSEKNNFVINKKEIILLFIPSIYLFQNSTLLFYLFLFMLIILILAPLPQLENIKLPYMTNTQIQNNSVEIENNQTYITANQDIQEQNINNENISMDNEQTLALDEDIDFNLNFS